MANFTVQKGWPLKIGLTAHGYGNIEQLKQTEQYDNLPKSNIHLNGPLRPFPLTLFSLPL